MNEKYYCYCPVCNKSDKTANFIAVADTLQNAKAKLEKHEQECHNGKPIGTFGKGKEYPKEIQ